MSKKEQQSTLRGRDASTGYFIPIQQARRNPATTVVERVPLPGKSKKSK
jgi:hypothetical protein